MQLWCRYLGIIYKFDDCLKYVVPMVVKAVDMGVKGTTFNVIFPMFSQAVLTFHNCYERILKITLTPDTKQEYTQKHTNTRYKTGVYS